MPAVDVAKIDAVGRGLIQRFVAPATTASEDP
jgi:hypothetical protein